MGKEGKVASAAERMLTVENSFNDYPLPNFGKSEILFFLYLCAKVKKGNDLLLKVNYIDFVNNVYSSIRMVRNMMEKLSNKLVGAWSTFKDIDGNLIHGTFFYDFKFEENYMLCSVNECLIKALLASTNFTALNLNHVASLSSPYSMKLYRKLKQFNGTGWYEVSLGEYRTIMGISENVKDKNVFARYIKPCIEELVCMFPNLTCEVKKSKKKGSPVVGFRFKWTKEERKKLTDGQKKAIQEKDGTTQKENKPVNKYLDYQQRHYTKDELEQLECMLLSR